MGILPSNKAEMFKNIRNMGNVMLYIPPVVWIISGYPLRQLFSEKTGLYISGGGLILALYILLVQLMLCADLKTRLVVRKRFWVYMIIWILFLSWGMLSNINSKYGSFVYQFILMAGVLMACLFALLRQFSIISIYRAAFWISFPFTLLWWMNFLKSGLVLDVTYRNASYGVVSLLTLSYAAFYLQFPFSIVVEALVIISLFINSQRISFFAGLLIIILQSLFLLRIHVFEVRRRIYLCIALLIFIFSAVLLNPGDIFQYTIDNVLMWNDPHRGAAAGFSGRLIIWNESIRIFSENPLWGWGTRANEVLLQEKSQVFASSTHNGILANLVDHGIPGGVLCITLMFWPVLLCLRSALFNVDKRHWLLLSLLGSYVLLGIGERYLFNVGNPTSVVILITLFFVMSDA